MPRLIDISAPLMAGIASDPPDMLPSIEYLDHHATAPRIAAYFGVGIAALPEGQYRQSSAAGSARIMEHM